MTSQHVQAETLTTAEVARLFRVDCRTVNRWMKLGRLVPTFRTPGGHARFARSEILTLIGDNGQESKITESYHD